MSRIYTARYQYNGPGRIDTTRRANHPLSPSWELVEDALSIRQGAAECFPASRFRERYLSELRVSYRARAEVWRALLADVTERGAGVIVCYCKHAPTCHRVTLADVLVAASARFGLPVERGPELRVIGTMIVCTADKRGRKCNRLSVWECPEELRPDPQREAK